MIYCVIPEVMEAELYERLSAYYADDPNVTVIVDRRRSERRGRGEKASKAEGEQRNIRDRRRARVPGGAPGDQAIVICRVPARSLARYRARAAPDRARAA